MEKASELSSEILKIAQNTILIKFRFFDMAIAELSPVVKMEENLSTNGVQVFYNPFHILKKYSQEQHVVTRDYLHMMLHCIFRHNFVSELLDSEIWDIACDITVENVINELQEASFDAKRKTLQTDLIEVIKLNQKYMTAEKIYRYYMDNRPSGDELNSIRAAFKADDHSIWYLSNELNSPQNDNDEVDSDINPNPLKSHAYRKSTEERWQEVAEHIEGDLKSFSKKKGDLAGNMMQNLFSVNREKYDYSTFLKKFATMTEIMKINDDEFDYIFYTYGLSLYEKMPLIEPLEYKEIKQIRDFVVIIDTSGSVQGELVQTFIQKTYNILKSTESFTSKVNIHVIQCDAEVQQDVKITTQNELERYIKEMKLFGFGGTDFRPAFQYVDDLLAKKEFTNLKGVIYFTDGYGTFPEKKPKYDAAFVLVRDDYEIPKIPSWAIKLVLEKDEVYKI